MVTREMVGSLRRSIHSLSERDKSVAALCDLAEAAIDLREFLDSLPPPFYLSDAVKLERLLSHLPAPEGT